jgi:hypothetical protein
VVRQIMQPVCLIPHSVVAVVSRTPVYSHIVDTGITVGLDLLHSTQRHNSNLYNI